MWWVAVQIPHDNPAQALVLAKQVTVLVYEGARKLCGDLSPVLVPPRYTLPPPPTVTFAALVARAAVSVMPVVCDKHSAVPWR